MGTTGRFVRSTPKCAGAGGAGGRTSAAFLPCPKKMEKTEDRMVADPKSQKRSREDACTLLEMEAEMQVIADLHDFVNKMEAPRVAANKLSSSVRKNTHFL